MDFRNSFLSGLQSEKTQDRVLRKFIGKNPDPSRNEGLRFEVGRMASAANAELGEISAILFEEKKSQEYGDCIHSIYIRKPNGEEYVWKEIWRDRIIEFDIDI